MHYQNRFRYIMVDEYQDTNYMQYRFVKMLADAATTKKNITFDELIVSEEYIGIAMPVNETMDALAIAA